ncbi:VOC family protein [Cupriavidus plantarum]|uniref:VOC family protein n=1 Tax=Cupriavidus plantarum TaxID=942865 RepID=UPI0015CCD20B|nr:VOC family protein [Cupriavidus plantarum]NYI02740.1 catechol-2,3-dioxygenase [Cupriavidus plantarum]
MNEPDPLEPSNKASENNVPRESVSGLTLNNFAIAVHDLSRMVTWYEQVLGLIAVERGTFDATGADYVMMEGAGTRLELVTLGGEHHVPVDRTAPPRHLDVLGYKALVFDTTDLHAVTRTLEQHDVEFIWADIQLNARRQSTMIRDPEGNMIHFFGPLQ